MTFRCPEVGLEFSLLGVQRLDHSLSLVQRFAVVEFVALVVSWLAVRQTADSIGRCVRGLL